MVIGVSSNKTGPENSVVTDLTSSASRPADNDRLSLHGLLDAKLAGHALHLSDQINFVLAAALSRKAMTPIPTDTPSQARRRDTHVWISTRWRRYFLRHRTGRRSRLKLSSPPHGQLSNRQPSL